MAEQRYDEQQVGAILQRATEIQAGITPEARGMTLVELQKVASEVGIEPHVIEKAAQEVRSEAIQPKPLDAPTSRMYDRTVEGELTDEHWDDIVMSLRKFAGRPGTTTLQGTTREWTDGSDTGSLTLTASSRNGRTRFRLLLDMSGAEAVGWVIGSIVGFLGMIAAGVSAGKGGLGPMITTLAVVTTLMLVGFVTSLSIRSWRKKTWKSATALFASLIAQAETRPSLPESGAPVEETPHMKLTQQS